MCQSRSGARRTALVFLVLALPVLTAAQAFTLENDGTGPGQQADGNAVNDSGQMVGSFLDSSGVSNAYVRLSPGVTRFVRRASSSHSSFSHGLGREQADFRLAEFLEIKPSSALILNGRGMSAEVVSAEFAGEQE